MADVKWIKIVTDIFDNEKILMIESMPDADALIVIWFKLLSLAGKKNNSGVFLMGTKPYTDEMFSTVLRRPLDTVRMALNTFEEYGMIERINNTVVIPHWDKYQSLDSYEKKKERDRIYQAERRASQKKIAEKSSDKSSDIVPQIRKDKKEDKIRADVDVDDNAEDGNGGNCDKTYKQFFKMNGSLGKGVVHITPEQIEDLLERIGLDAFNYYVEKLADYIIKNNAKVTNHYETILKWANEDSQVKSGED